MPVSVKQPGVDSVVSLRAPTAKTIGFDSARVVGGPKAGAAGLLSLNDFDGPAANPAPQPSFRRSETQRPSKSRGHGKPERRRTRSKTRPYDRPASRGHRDRSHRSAKPAASPPASPRAQPNYVTDDDLEVFANPVKRLIDPPPAETTPVSRGTEQKYPDNETSASEDPSITPDAESEAETTASESEEEPEVPPSDTGSESASNAGSFADSLASGSSAAGSAAALARQMGRGAEMRNAFPSTAAPLEPPPPPMRPLSGQERIKRKARILARLERKAKFGGPKIEIPQDADLETLETLYEKVTYESNADEGVKLYRRFLMWAVATEEQLSKRFPAAGLDLDRWSESVYLTLDTYDAMLYDVYDEYGDKHQMNPLYRLILAVQSNAIMYSTTRKIMKGSDQAKEKATQAALAAAEQRARAAEARVAQQGQALRQRQQQVRSPAEQAVHAAAASGANMFTPPPQQLRPGVPSATSASRPGFEPSLGPGVEGDQSDDSETLDAPSSSMLLQRLRAEEDSQVRTQPVPPREPAPMTNAGSPTTGSQSTSARAVAPSGTAANIATGPANMRSVLLGTKPTGSKRGGRSAGAGGLVPKRVMKM